MDIQYFSSLSSDEVQQLLDAPSMVAILIAGADQDIDKKEKDWATRLVHYRTFTSDPKLHQYYEAVNEDFDEKLQSLAEGWQAESTEAQLSAKLGALKDVLSKIDAEIADLLKASWRSMAQKVAEASGGIVGFGSVSKEESRIVDLPMLD